MPASSRSCSWQLDARIKAVRRGVLLVQALPLLAYWRIALVIDWDRRIALVIDREPSMHHEDPLPSLLFRRPMIERISGTLDLSYLDAPNNNFAVCVCVGLRTANVQTNLMTQ